MCNIYIYIDLQRLATLRSWRLVYAQLFWHRGPSCPSRQTPPTTQRMCLGIRAKSRPGVSDAEQAAMTWLSSTSSRQRICHRSFEGGIARDDLHVNLCLKCVQKCPVVRGAEQKECLAPTAISTCQRSNMIPSSGNPAGEHNSFFFRQQLLQQQDCLFIRLLIYTCSCCKCWC